MKTKQQKHKRNWNKILTKANLFIGLIVMMFSIYLFCMGFHNMDLGQNLKWINAEYHLNLGDQPLFNKPQSTPTEMYLSGVQQMIISIPLMFLGVYLFATSFSKYKYQD